MNSQTLCPNQRDLNRALDAFTATARSIVGGLQAESAALGDVLTTMIAAGGELVWIATISPEPALRLYLLPADGGPGMQLAEVRCTPTAGAMQ